MARFSRRTSTFKRRNPIQNFPGCRHFLETETGNTLQEKNILKFKMTLNV